MKIRDKQLLYHLTHIDNIESILVNGLLSRNAAKQLGEFTDVANQDIIKSRHQHDLDDHVLFHFHPYSAFDVSVKEKFGKENFVYITVKRETAKKKGFKVVARHPLNGIFQLHDYDEGFQLIEWEIMETPMSSFIKLEDKIQAKQIKMAECISAEPVLVSDFFKIYCNKESLSNLKEKHNKYKNNFTDGVWLN